MGLLTPCYKDEALIQLVNLQKRGAESSRHIDAKATVAQRKGLIDNVKKKFRKKMSPRLEGRSI
jgi:hypothetical protein